MIEEKVEEILRKHEKSKDDDRELFLAWIFYMEHMTDEEREAFKLFTGIMRRMPSLETLTRARRKLQERNPYMRGLNYKPRKKRAEDMRQHYRYTKD